jgi:cytochrome P450/glutathione S-transferase
MLTIPVSPFCEVAKWVLDRLGIPYVEECHAPVFYTFHAFARRAKNVWPLLLTGDAKLAGARAVLDYYEPRCPREKRLVPEDPRERAEARKLFDLLYEEFGPSVRAWAYAYMLPWDDDLWFLRETDIRCWTYRVSRFEHAALPILYRLMLPLVKKNLQITKTSVAEERPLIDAFFQRIDAQLQDGRPYLLGDRFTIVDLAFAALAAPAVLPDRYDGPLPTFAELPDEMREAVEGYRRRPSGQFALRIYERERDRRVLEGVTGRKPPLSWQVRQAAPRWVTHPSVLRPASWLLRRWAPIAVLGRRALVSRHDDVLEVFRRDADFTVSEINGARMSEIDCPFILGMDRSPTYDRDLALLRQVVGPADAPKIRSLVASSAADLVDAAKPYGRIDVVGGFARIVGARLLAGYFGVRGTTEPALLRWMRQLFQHVFLDPGGDARVRANALRSCAALRHHLDAEIARRKAHGALSDGDVLGRLLMLQGAERPWLDDDAVRRQLGGLIVGAVETTSKFVTLAIDELLRRPEVLAEARCRARAGDLKSVHRLAIEAVRFRPHAPFQVRHCRDGAELAAGTARATRIPAGSLVVLGTLSAMFDPQAFPEPLEFRSDRSAEYLHFGHGLHRCFGEAVNAVQIPELLSVLLRLTNLRRAPGRVGRIAWDGPFPDRLVLEFDANVGEARAE